jgi:hypothetical protein
VVCLLCCAGLAATLGLIKDKGMLKDTTQWAGRNNDKKAVALIGLEDVYTGEGLKHELGSCTCLSGCTSCWRCMCCCCHEDGATTAVNLTGAAVWAFCL